MIIGARINIELISITYKKINNKQGRNRHAR
jgi:hypothetical protein